MIALDTNLLVYAYREDSKFHLPAMEHLRPVMEGGSPWALPWPCVHEFLGVVTSGRVYKPASPLSNALSFLDSLLASPQLHLLSESPGYFEKLRELATRARLSGPRIHDARIAALCLHHGVRELWTADRDFSSFPKLKTRNPLVKK
ncbi:MAG: PIN domain-containing protein [Verrucomicrobiota bacterium]|nr:PIN domain-containing protein [Verrucomicrobiota bacterium]